VSKIRAILSQSEWDVIEKFGESGSVYLWYDPTAEPKDENLTWDQAVVAEGLVKRGYVWREQRDDEDWCVYYAITPRCFDETMEPGQYYIVTVGTPKKREQVGPVIKDNAQKAYDFGNVVRTSAQGKDVFVVALRDYKPGGKVVFDEYDLLWPLG